MDSTEFSEKYETMSELLGGFRIGYIRCEPSTDGDALLRGLSQEIKKKHPSGNINLFRFENDHLQPEEGDQISSSLINGEIVVMFFTGESSFSQELAIQWINYIENEGDVPITVLQNLRLPQKTVSSKLGYLLIVHAAAAETPFPGKGCPIFFGSEYNALEEVGKSLLKPEILVFGVSSYANGTGITMKDLCLLHQRDSYEPTRSCTSETEHSDPSKYPFTWKNLQELLHEELSAKEFFERIDSLHQQGIINDQHHHFGLEAFDYLEDRKTRKTSPQIFESIYDVVWYLDGENTQRDFIYRGQSDVSWRLDNALLRKTPAEPLDIQLLHERVSETEAFLADLKKDRPELNDLERLAIAQHYGFATPLLDFTRSHRIAAFFATNCQRNPKKEKECIGVIYQLRLVNQGLETQQQSYYGLEKFSLLKAAAFHFGVLNIIEPKLPDKENRIARQQGVFLAGYQLHELQNIAIDRHYFRQQPGTFFEDETTGITKEFLLSDQSELSKLAEERKKHIEKASIEIPLNATVATTILSEISIIGSSGAQLFAQMRDAKMFFKALNKYIALLSAPEHTTVLDTVSNIFEEYFRVSRVLAMMGELPDITNEREFVDPIGKATDQLAEMSKVDRDLLWNTIKEHIPGDTASQSQNKTTQANPQFTPTTEMERIATACTLYLAGWEHLRHIEGKKARDLTINAIRALNVF